MMNQRDRVKKKRGLTLADLVTTVGIIGTLTAISVPAYIRFEMHMKMENVRQELRVMQQALADHLNHTNFFPQNLTDLGNSVEEVAIAQSLQVISDHNYRIDGYQTNDIFTDYSFRTCPQSGYWAFAGDKCFHLDSLGVVETEPWDGESVQMTAFGVTRGEGFFSTLFSDPNISEKERADILAGLFQEVAVGLDGQATTGNAVPSQYFVVTADNLAQFKSSFETAYGGLEKYGISIYQMERTVTSEVLSYSVLPGPNPPANQAEAQTIPPGSSILEVGFRITSSALQTNLEAKAAFEDFKLQLSGNS